MKTILVLLLASSAVLSIRLTPNTHLPDILRNALENSLQRNAAVGLGRPNRRIDHAVSDYFTVSNLKVAGDFLSEELPWLNPKSKKWILEDTKYLREQDLVSHFVSQGDETEGRFEAVINTVKDEGVVRMVVSREYLKTASRSKLPLYHEKRSSKVGLPLSAAELLAFSNLDTNQKRYYDNSRLRILNELYQRIGSSYTSMKSMSGLGVGVIDALNAVVGAWQSIANNFKTTSSTTLKNVIQGKGFSKFKADSIVMNNQGIRMSIFHLFKPNYIVAIGYDGRKDLASKANDWLDLALLVDNNACNVNDMVFDLNKDGECSSNVVLTAKDEVAQKVHILTAITNGMYKLTPDVWIYEVNKSYAGGIYQEMKEKREYKARSLTEGDIKAITALASLNAVNKFSEHFGIKFELPTDNPTDFCK